MNFREYLKEAKEYYIEVSVRSASKAQGIIDDMFRRKVELESSNYFISTNEDIMYDLLMTFEKYDIEVLNTNVEK